MLHQVKIIIQVQEKKLNHFRMEITQKAPLEGAYAEVKNE